MEANLKKRLENDVAYYKNRICILLNIIYRQPEKAFEQWQTLYNKGHDKAHATLTVYSHMLGKLKGKLILGFKKTQDRNNAELAIPELSHLSKKHHLATLQLEELNKLTKEKQVQYIQKKNWQEIAEKRQTEINSMQQTNTQQR